MRVLYVTSGITPYVVGGMQAVSRRQIIGLQKSGFDISFVHTFRGEARIKTDIPGDEHVIDYPKSRGVSKCWPWHYPRELKAYSRAVDAIVKQTSPDLVYGEGPLVYATLQRADRPRVVFHPHGLDMYQDQMSLIRNVRSHTLRPLFRFHAKNSDCVISQGGQLTQILTNKMAVLPHRVAFLPNAVPETAGGIRPVRREGPLKCLFVGRDDPKKGFGLLLAAMEVLPEVELDVVGMDGPPTEKIRWHGIVRDSSRIREFYRNADVLVLPSYSEGMATVLLESMQLGTPAIATDVGASREVVINNKTGWLIAPGSIPELLAAISEVRDLDAERYGKYVNMCREHIKDNFTDTLVRDRLASLLRSVVTAGKLTEDNT